MNAHQRSINLFGNLLIYVLVCVMTCIYGGRCVNRTIQSLYSHVQIKCTSQLGLESLKTRMQHILNSCFELHSFTHNLYACQRVENLFLMQIQLPPMSTYTIVHVPMHTNSMYCNVLYCGCQGYCVHILPKYAELCLSCTRQSFV